MQRLLFGRVRLGGRKNREPKEGKWFSTPSDWNRIKIGAVAKEISKKNANRDDLPVLSCTKYQGLVSSLEYFDKQIFSINTSTYKIVERGHFAYATNHIEEGSIGYQDLYPKALISPMYTVFKTDPDKINDGYLYKLLKTETFRRIFAINTNASVDRRGSLRWNDFSKLPIPLPPLSEQQEINQVLDTAQQEISLLKKKLDLLKTQKRGLMQKLLTGIWRLKTI
jgi:type I restriction enzyme S subunit